MRLRSPVLVQMLFGTFALVLVAAACGASSPSSRSKASTAGALPEQPTGAQPVVSSSRHAVVPAPAPPGTVTLGRVYVQTCADSQACPELLKDAGAVHCKALDLGGLSWRLPRLEELESWRGNSALIGYDVFHWSGSEWDDSPGQFWIYDPGTGAKTTTKPDRKAFTIRCVADPAE